MSNQALPSAPKKHTALRVTMAVLSGVCIVGVLVAMAIIPPSWIAHDSVPRENARMAQTVSQTQLASYCPARMDLADSGSYGDSEFQASSGNVTSSARYAAFGSVYRATVSRIGNDEDSINLDSDSNLDANNAKVASGDVNDGARFVDTRLLQAQSGSGMAASVVSWATEGDLRGVSAASCVAPSLEQRFVLPSSATGTTHQLVVANPSSKATSLQIEVWGTSSSGALSLSTASSLNVAAQAESVLDLSAAAPSQDGLYVKVSSKETPIAAVVRTVKIDGLTSKGSDYAEPLPEAQRSAVLSGVSADDEVSIELFSEQDTTVTVYWLGKEGRSEAKKQDLAAQRVSVVDAGKAPQDTYGVMVETDGGTISASAQLTRSGDGDQQDFALTGMQSPAQSSAITIPDNVQATVLIANTADQQESATIQAFDASGKALGSKEITVDASSSLSMKPEDIDENAELLLMKDNSALAWSARVQQQSVSDAKLAGLAVITPIALEPQNETIWAQSDQHVVQ